MKRRKRSFYFKVFLKATINETTKVLVYEKQHQNVIIPRDMLVNGKNNIEINFEDAKVRNLHPHNFELPSFDFVKECACQVTGIDLEKFHSKSRKGNIVLARHLFATYFLSNDVRREYTINSIATSCKLANHTSAIHGSTTISNCIETRDPKITPMVTEFLRLIASNNPLYPIQIRPIRRQKRVVKTKGQ